MMFASRIHFVVRPYGVHFIRSCSAFNEEFSTVENNYGNGALIKCSDWYTAIIKCFNRNKLIFDDKHAYAKAKEL